MYAELKIIAHSFSSPHPRSGDSGITGADLHKKVGL